MQNPIETASSTIAENGKTHELATPPVNAIAKNELTSFIETSDTYRVSTEDPPSVEPDREFVRKAAWNGSGEDVVQTHHSALFSRELGTERESLVQVALDVFQNIQSGESHMSALVDELDQNERYCEDRQEPKLQEPKLWRISERIRVLLMLFFGMLVLAVDVNTAAVTWLQSGIAHFDTYWKAALFNLAIIIGGAALIETVHIRILSRRNRQRFFFIIASAAFISLSFAIPVLAKTAGQMTADPISLMTGGAEGFDRTNPVTMFILLVTTGNLIAGTVVIAAIGEIDSHHLPSRILNPSWETIKRDLDEISRKLRIEREKLGLVRGRLQQIAAAETVLITEAVELYRIAVAERSAFKSL